MTEENNHLVTLQDDNGKDVVFEHLMTVNYEGADYILLEATEDIEDCKQGESIILRIEEEDGEEVYATIEDEAEYQAVFDKCLAAIEEEDEDEDEDEGDEE